MTPLMVQMKKLVWVLLIVLYMEIKTALLRYKHCEYYLGITMGLCLDLMESSYLDLFMDSHLVHLME